MPMTGVGGAVPDELLRQTGVGTGGTWFETYTTTTNETGRFYGEYMLVDFRLIVTAIGVTSGTTTDYTAIVSFEDSASETTGYTAMGYAFSTLNSAGGDHFAVTGQATELPHRTVRTRSGRPYVRPVITLAGTNPTVTLAIVPVPGGIVA